MEENATKDEYVYSYDKDERDSLKNILVKKTKAQNAIADWLKDLESHILTIGGIIIHRTNGGIISSVDIKLSLSERWNKP